MPMYNLAEYIPWNHYKLLLQTKLPNLIKTAKGDQPALKRP